MKTILCYGDSNTYGLVPGSLNPATGYRERYSKAVRWPGQLQALLGPEYQVIEEGLCARTTDLDYPEDTWIENRNGLRYLESCLASHSPIDAVILFLGINDLKTIFHRSAQEIANGIDHLVQVIQTSSWGPGFTQAPQVLIVGYPPIQVIPAYADMFQGAVEKGQALPAELQRIATLRRCHYVDAVSELAFDARDGVHLNEAGHQKLAEIVYRQVKKEVS